MSADLNQALHDYQRLYVAAYGASEKIAELIPFMLAAFLDSDRAFVKARKEGFPVVDSEKGASRTRSPRMSEAEPAPPSSEEHKEGSDSHPIFELQPLHTREFARVVRHQHAFCSQRMTRNHDVIAADGAFPLLPDPA